MHPENTRSYVFLAEGFEEVEAITVIDVLRRAKYDVKSVSICETNTVVGAHGVPVVADMMFDEVEPTRGWFILPGGMPGATNLRAHEKFCEMLVKHTRFFGKTAAICASPVVVLHELGLLDDRYATCYPGMERRREGVDWCGTIVTTDSNIITARGPGAAFEFALDIVLADHGFEVRDELALELVCEPAAYKTQQKNWRKYPLIGIVHHGPSPDEETIRKEAEARARGEIDDDLLL